MNIRLQSIYSRIKICCLGKSEDKKKEFFGLRSRSATLTEYLLEAPGDESWRISKSAKSDDAKIDAKILGSREKKKGGRFGEVEKG